MRVLKFDLLYPEEYLHEVQINNKSLIKSMTLNQYVNWLHEQKMLYGELISKAFVNHGYEVMDIYVNDPIYINKLKQEFKIRVSFLDFLFVKKRVDFFHSSFKEVLASFRNKKAREKLFNEVLIKRVINKYCPDIIFLREPCGVNNLVFQDLKKRHFIVSLVGCSVPGLKNWRFDFSDLIFTLFPHYKAYFQSNGIKSKLFEYGTIKLPIYKGEKKYDVSFVGVLGTRVQFQKSELLESVASVFNFKWWGVKGELIDQFPNLNKSWQGNAAGIKMFEIYQQSKIILNDYPYNANGQASNIRIKEVFSSGSMLLTRHTDELSDLLEKKMLAVFSTDQDCIEKIKYFLINEVERQQIADNGRIKGEHLYDGLKLMERYISEIEEEMKSKKLQ